MGQVSADYIIVGENVGCGSLVVEFQDVSVGNPALWLWDFGNGFTSSDQNPLMVFSPGTYDVTLKVSNNISQDSITFSEIIKVYENPIPIFQANIVSGCTPLEVLFEDQSTSSTSIDSWYWDFGDGGNDSIENPSYTFLNSGNQSISLLVVDSNLCSALTTVNNYIKVENNPHIDFIANPEFICQQNQLIEFSNMTTDTALYNYIWDFGDGQTSSILNPSHIYINQGVYDVSLIANGVYCSDTLIKHDVISMGVFPIDFSSEDTIGCENDLNVNFESITSEYVTDWFWDFGDGNTSLQSNPIHSYSLAGVYDVVLQVSNQGSCVTQLTKQNFIMINSNPEVNFSVSDSVSCQLPFLIELEDLTLNSFQWRWKLGDSIFSNDENPQLFISEQGIFDLELEVIGINGCSSSLLRADFIKIDWPDIDFESDETSGCAPFNIGFQNLIVSDVPIVDYFWDFGNGSTSYLSNPDIFYQNPGLFSVELVVENEIGCISSNFKNNYIQVSESPNVNFSVSNNGVCGNDSVFFSDLSTSNDSIDSWYWSFGDAPYLNSIIQNPVHSYQDTGYQNVELIVGVNNCFDTLSVDSCVYVDSPLANFYVVQNCDLYNEVAFHNESIDYDSCLWSFGDGIYSTLNHPTHFYSNYGTYEVILKLFNQNSSCPGEVFKTITVEPPYPNLVVDPFTVSLGCPPLTVLFHDISPYSDENPNSLYNVQDKIIFGDGNFSNNNYENTYEVSGYYNVQHIVGNPFGCLDTITYDSLVHVYEVQVDFDILDVISCEPYSISFLDNSNSDDVIDTWYWEVDNGLISYDQNPIFTFYDEGLYDVELSIVTQDGCSDSLLISDFILYDPVDANAHFVEIACVGDSVLISSESSGINVSIDWSFSNEISDSVWLFSNHVGPQNNFLLATDQYLCVDTAFIEIDFIKPVADFIVDNISSECPPLFANFIDFSTQSVVYWEWIFGDSSASFLQSPSHLFSESGVYDVSLLVSDSLGCKDTLEIIEAISITGPSGSFSISDNSVCTFESVQFSPLFDNTSSVLWDFGDSTYSNIDTVHSYQNIGVYHPKLTLMNQFGCEKIVYGDSISVNSNTVYINHSNDFRICKHDSIEINLTSNGTVLDWSPNLYLTDTISLSTIAFPDTTITYVISLEDGSCVKQDSITIYVDEKPSSPSFITSPLCVYDEIIFTNTSDMQSYYTCLWNINDTLIYDEFQPVVSFSSIGCYPVSMIVTDDSTSCSTIFNDTLLINMLPLIDAGENQFVCHGNKVVLNASGGINYSWQGGDSDSSKFEFIADSTNIYQVEGIDHHGCKNKDDVLVVVKPMPELSVLGPVEGCLGEEITLYTEDGTNAIWGDSISISNQFNILLSESFDLSVGKLGYNECSVSTSISIQVFDYSALSLLVPDTICFGEEIWLDFEISGSDIDTVEWSVQNDSFSRRNFNYVFSDIGENEVLLSVVNINNCTSIDSANIFVRDPPDAAFITLKNNEFDLGLDFLVKNDSYYSYYWDFGDGMMSYNMNPYHNYDSPGVYEVFLEVKDEYMCKHISKEIITINSSLNFWIPNAFTPNNDGLDDVFYIQGSSSDDFVMYIYNRWGEKVFTSHRLDEGWSGENAVPDAYTYLIIAKDSNGKEYVYRGEVHLIL